MLPIDISSYFNALFYEIVSSSKNRKEAMSKLDEFINSITNNYIYHKAIDKSSRKMNLITNNIVPYLKDYGKRFITQHMVI